MKITTLVENTSLSPEYKSKHGLSLYIETTNHKILFDLGSNDLFVENAERLGIDIRTIDTVVISHGHTDHAGALRKFLEINPTAKIYIKESAFDKHYTKVMGIPFYAGADIKLKDNRQFIFTTDSYMIDEELRLFSGIKGRKFFSQSNNQLLTKKNHKFVLDSFDHEQYLVIEDENQRVLISGCSHNGIVNIMEEMQRAASEKFTHVIGGFHLFNPISKKYEKDELIRDVAECLKQYNCKYYTCHCTGPKAYKKMKEIMGERLNYLSTGSRLQIK
ncbi:MAG: MBL fold metallo-hydrolase [Lachnospiraceae bacterium]|nr:MBL fold metallo-hydrolase [Lachnospiraceae bacterium]